jgi:hypothetical protein
MARIAYTQGSHSYDLSCGIVGHEKGTIGYGHYSGGASLANKKEAIEKVKYPFPCD